MKLIMNKNEIKIYFWITMIVFVLFTLQGYFGAVENPEEATKIINEFQEEFSFIQNWNSFSIFLLIFLNNSIKAFAVILLGFFFGMAPFLLLAANGTLLGVVAYIVSQESGWTFLFLGILPHGIFEIPALILSVSYGLWLGVKFYRKIKYNESFKSHFIHSIKFFGKIILPLLFIAALIEAFVTPILINLVVE